MSLKSYLVLILVPFALSACGTAARLDSARNDFATGRYEKLAPRTDASNLDLLIGAQSSFQDNKYANSDNLFESFNKRGIDPTKTSTGRELTQLVGGQTAADYKPYMMDYLFASYYQLWDALLLGNSADARVIINQSYARQQKMSSAYKNQIQSRQKSDLAKSLAANTSTWAAYSDIMNPALTYLAGLYFLNNGEYENARQYLTRAAGMMPNNTYIKSDLAVAEQRIRPTHTAWIFIESGFAPRLRERQINIPWPVGDDLQVISIATTYPEISAAAGQCPGPAEILADVNAMFLTEFKEYQVNDALRALTKSASNIAVQSAASDALNGWGNVLGAVYTIATTNAEVRSWVTLPAQVCLLRVQKDKSGLIKLPSGDTITTDYSGNNLIYIRGRDIKQILIK